MGENVSASAPDPEDSLETGAELRVSLPCACCAGGVELDDPGAVLECPWCGDRGYLDQHRLLPHIARSVVSAGDALPEIKRWLRESGHRATSVGDLGLVHLPFYHLVTRGLTWPTEPTDDPGRDTGPARSDAADGIQEWTRIEQIPAWSVSGDQSEWIREPGAREERYAALAAIVSRDSLGVQIPGDAREELDEAPPRGHGRVPAGSADVVLECRRSLAWVPHHVLACAFREQAYTVVADAVTGAVRGRVEGEFPDASAASPLAELLVGDGLPDQRPLACPDCGHGLDCARADQRVFRCQCLRYWQLVGGELVAIDARADAGEGELLPFWRVRGALRRIPDPDDLMAASVPVPESAAASTDLCLHVPAFEPCPVPLLRRLIRSLRDRAVDAGEACEGSTRAWACTRTAPIAEALVRRAEPGFQPETATLQWLRFRADKGFLVEPISGARIPQAALED